MKHRLVATMRDEFSSSPSGARLLFLFFFVSLYMLSCDTRPSRNWCGRLAYSLQLVFRDISFVYFCICFCFCTVKCCHSSSLAPSMVQRFQRQIDEGVGLLQYSLAGTLYLFNLALSMSVPFLALIFDDDPSQSAFASSLKPNYVSYKIAYSVSTPMLHS